MATIKVNSAVMREKADAFRNVSSTIKNFIEDMKTEINGMKSAWEGDAAEISVDKFNMHSIACLMMCDVINQYANFLESAADNYDKVESANAQGNGGQ